MNLSGASMRDRVVSKGSMVLMTWSFSNCGNLLTYGRDQIGGVSGCSYQDHGKSYTEAASFARRRHHVRDLAYRSS